MNPSRSFSDNVYAYVGRIPAGRVMTYGQLAGLCGHPRAARVVGGIAHHGPAELPWHRVVNKQGGLAGEFPGGRSEQAKMLEAEGVAVSDDYKIDVNTLIWWPND